MLIRSDDRIAFPRDLVYRTYRDRLRDLVPYLPNVGSIEVTERREEGETIHVVNRWRAKAEIPAVARGVLSPDMLAWDDRATWTPWTTDWRTTMLAVSDAVDCHGRNEFVEEDGATVIRIRGDLHVDLRQFRGVPRLLAGTIGPVVEKFVVAMITPNLAAVSRGVERLLRAERSG
jgi:hypothetical protein